MKLNVSKEVAALRRLTMQELRARYADLFGDATPSGNRVWLVRRIVWRMQALAEGDLSDRARQRAAELANDADLRVIAPAPPRQPKPQPPPAPPRTKGKPAARSRPGVPMPGTVIARVYKGERLEVRVQADGFEFEGTLYASLSAVAQAITGSHWNGRLFFGLNGKAGDR
jgi:Protein of unknown function (DUF2924)